MNSKIVIHTDMEILTGLHIGGSDIFSAIGAIDSPVIRDKRTQEPIVPGSSLKGKIRTLLVRSTQDKPADIKNDPDEIKHLFGSINPIVRSRLQFADSMLKNRQEFEKLSDITEAKMENTIDRVTAIANPRQIERVVRGAVFYVSIVYNEEDPSQTISDLKLLAKGLELLQIDYLGGHGTRGSGRVSFHDFRAEIKGDSKHSEDEITSLFKDVENYDLLSVI